MGYEIFILHKNLVSTCQEIKSIFAIRVCWLIWAFRLSRKICHVSKYIVTPLFVSYSWIGKLESVFENIKYYGVLYFLTSYPNVLNWKFYNKDWLHVITITYLQKFEYILWQSLWIPVMLRGPNILTKSRIILLTPSGINVCA